MCDTILYDGVVLVRMTWYRLFTLSIVCWVSPYLQRIGTTRSFFIVVVHLLVVVLIVDWYMYMYMYMYMHILLQFVDTTHVAFLSCADDDVYIVMSVSICSHKDNYYTIIPSIYDQLGDSVDFSI